MIDLEAVLKSTNMHFALGCFHQTPNPLRDGVITSPAFEYSNWMRCHPDLIHVHPSIEYERDLVCAEPDLDFS